MTTPKQQANQLQFGSQYGKRQTTAEAQVEKFIQQKMEQLKNVNANTPSEI